jgi:hypothetical protein
MPVTGNGMWLTSIDKTRQQELLHRHMDFWYRKRGSQALIGYAPMSRMFPLQHLCIKHEGPFFAEHVTTEIMYADTEYRPPYETEDDLFPGKIPLEPLAWSEGYTGANIYLSSKAQTVWAKPEKQIPETLEQVKKRLSPAWKNKLAEATRINRDTLNGEYLISEALLRGPADCLEALIGTETLCLWLYDKPQLVKEIVNWLTDCIIRLYQCQFEQLGLFNGGTINRYRIWGPGQNIVTQADIVNVMSPEHFRQFFIPAYRKLAQAFDTAAIHFHSSAARHIDALLEIGELAAIEWALDPTGPTLEEMVEVFRKIQRHGKGVIIMNLKTKQEVNMLLDNLQPEGLCLIVRKDY